MTVKELKTNNMAYTPYKMKGHELKGIKQRGVPFTGGVGSDEMQSGVGDKFSAVPFSKTASPNKGWFKDLGKKIAGGAKKFAKGEGALGLLNPLGRGISEMKKKAQSAAGGGGGDLEGRVAALEAGSGGGGAAANPAMTMMGMTPEMSGVMMRGGDGAKPLAAEAMKKKKMAEGWGGAGGVDLSATTNAVTAMSDIRLKEKIEKAGKSPSGIPIYVFSYIGDNRRYEGAMAQDLISMGIDAVETQESGYYSVDYSKIDVDMKLIN